jgi:predicted Zn-ribbon and HTH transcriptional regulator
MYVKTGKNAMIMTVLTEASEPLTAREITAKAGLYRDEVKSVSSVLAGFKKQGKVEMVGKKVCPEIGYEVSLYEIKKP